MARGDYCYDARGCQKPGDVGARGRQKPGGSHAQGCGDAVLVVPGHGGASHVDRLHRIGAAAALPEVRHRDTPFIGRTGNGASV